MSRTLLKIALLTVVAVVVAAAQTATPPAPPAPPACLSGTVMQGTISVSCSLIDSSAIGAGGDTLSGIYIFQVRVVSSDPDVNVIRIQLTTTQAFNSSQFVQTRSVLAQKTAVGFSYTFIINAALNNDSTVAPLSISPLTIQELKPSSSQSI